MFEIFGQKDIEEVIEVNKLICSYDNEPVGVNMEILNSIFDKSNSFNDMPDRKTRIIKKATHIIVGISYNQPFVEGNRRTSHYLVKNFLRRNLFQLRFYNAKEEDQFANVLKPLQTKLSKLETKLDSIDNNHSHKQQSRLNFLEEISKIRLSNISRPTINFI